MNDNDEIAPNLDQGHNVNSHVEAIRQCKLPIFWRSSPEAWFVQIEALFDANQIRSDNTRYNLVVAALDPESVQDLLDVLRSIPQQGKYAHLKTQVLARFADSTEQRMTKLFTKVELGHRTPSQLLRHMRNLADGTQIPDDAIKVKWFNLLPGNMVRILRILKNSTLDEIAEAADELHDVPPGLQAVTSSCPRSQSPRRPQNSYNSSSVADQAAMAADMASIKASLAQIAASSHLVLEAVRGLQHQQPRGRSQQARGRSRSRPRAATPTGACYYHYKFGADALQAGSGSDQTLRENRLIIMEKNTGLQFLVDSGSVVSLLPRTAIEERLAVQELQLAAANKSVIRTYGRRMVTLNLGLRRDFTWPCIIADVHNPILGADFLASTGLLIDMQRRRLVDPATTLSVSAGLQATSVYSVQCCSTDDQHRAAYDQLLVEFKDVTRPGKQRATLRGAPVVHHIHTTGPPVFERPRPLHGERLQAAKSEFHTLLQRGIIKPSSSQWASPLHMVAKKSGGYRATGDYRRLNACTLPDRYPIPVIEDILHDCHGCHVFSTLDLEKGFYQIPMAAEHVDKTAVTTPFGLYEFHRLSMGLRNATQTFQRFMDALFRDMPFVRIYIDDCLIKSRSHHEHQQHLRMVFQRLREAGLAINLEKCHFGQAEVQYLGYLVSHQGFKPPAHKVEAVMEFTKPSNAKELRRFLGMVNYYRRCIPGAATRQAPLIQLLCGLPKGKHVKLQWTPEAEAAFQACKEDLRDAATNTFLSPTAPLQLVTDASDTGIGAVLEQLTDGAWHPVGYFSRKLSSTESRYSTYDRELLGIFAAVKHFNRYLEGRSFTALTDHKPLTYAGQQRSEKASPRQQRQLDYILQHNITLKHIKGEDNVVADALSRVSTIGMPSGLLAKDIEAAQQQDDELPHLLNNSILGLQLLDIEGSSVACNIDEGIVRPYLPACLRRHAFHVLHSPAHPSPRATTKIVTAKFVWPGIKKDVDRWSRSCEPCQLSKVSRHNRAALSSFNVPSNRFEHVHLDIITMPQVGKLRYCLTMIDRFSRWPTAVALEDISAETVVQAFLEHWVASFGCPLLITTDQGRQFESALLSALANTIGAQRLHTTPYHPQANGLVERFHRTLKAALMCEKQTPWPRRLPIALLGLRNCLKEDLQASPAEMTLGTTLRLPGEFFVHSTSQADPANFVDKFRQLMRDIKPVPTSDHAKHRPFQFKDLSTCTHVFHRVDAVRKPLQPPYTGPHEVIKLISSKVYTIKVNDEERTVSTDTLKPAYLDTSDPPQKPHMHQHQPEEHLAEPETAPSHRALPQEASPSAPAILKKRVSFPSLPAKVTEGGVAVGTTPQSAMRPPTRQQGPQRRKQELTPRIWSDAQSTSPCASDSASASGLRWDGHVGQPRQLA